MGNGRKHGKQGKEQHGARRGRTEIVFILDASGSMAGLEDDTVGGFNAMIEENRKQPGEAFVSTIIFNTTSHVLHDRVDIREVPRLTRREYRCMGCTALLDAVGGAIKHVDLVQRVQPAGYAADKVLFVITTDGYENASRRFTYPEVKRLIEQHRTAGWEFLFIGANIDVEETAEQLGIACDRAAAYVPDAAGTDTVYEAMATAVAGVRACRSGERMGDAWRSGLDADVARRG